MKRYNEFYILANPELLIKTHFPEDEKWQLTKERYKPLVKNNFYKHWFERYSPDEGLIELKNSNEKKFTVYDSDMPNKTTLYDIFLLQGNI